MGLGGNIIVFPVAGSPPTDPDPIARLAVAAFERHGLLLPDTASACVTPKPWIGRFAEHREKGILAPTEYALYLVQPERVTLAMRELVWILDVDQEGKQVPIELPYVEFSVITRKLPIINGYDGRTLCTTWATIDFGYEDVRLDEEIHRIRNERHPVLKSLAEVFSSPVSWDVFVG